MGSWIRLQVWGTLQQSQTQKKGLFYLPAYHVFHAKRAPQARNQRSWRMLYCNSSGIGHRQTSPCETFYRNVFGPTCGKFKSGVPVRMPWVVRNRRHKLTLSPGFFRVFFRAALVVPVTLSSRSSRGFPCVSCVPSGPIPCCCGMNMEGFLRAWTAFKSLNGRRSWWPSPTGLTSSTLPSFGLGVSKYRCVGG